MEVSVANVPGCINDVPEYFVLESLHIDIVKRKIFSPAGNRNPTTVSSRLLTSQSLLPETEICVMCFTRLSVSRPLNITTDIDSYYTRIPPKK